MSKWYDINKEDVSLSDDSKSLQVNFDSDHDGNLWIDIPMEYIKQLTSQWISVKDSLPEPTQPVFVHVEKELSFRKGKKTCVVEPGYLTSLKKDGTPLFMPVFGDSNAFQYITHWMPIPEPPQ